ncbi:MAG: hypothetical protein E6K15_08800 [Methanobacteriota archaeon]|nr:MAG: hypothetical protein E6K15_08800 [Euryarchaeota archaeon]
MPATEDGTNRLLDFFVFCTTRHDEELPVHCIRTFALAEMLRIRLDADFDWQLNRFGRPCQITLTRSRWRKN